MTLCTSCKNNDVCIVTNMDAIRGNCIYYTPKTNADQFRAKSDDELAEFQANIGYCPPIHNRGYHCKRHKHESCSACWLNWLQSPAGGDGDG